MLNIKRVEKKDVFLTILIVAVAILDISLIFNDSVWGDEAYTMLMIKRTFTDIVKVTATDVHPPLYYFIAKIYTIILGYSVATVKLASITPLILTMIFIKSKAKKIFKEDSFLITVLFILLIGLFPRAIAFSIELRMYTWAMFFVTCSGIYAYQLYENPKDKKTTILFILSALGAAYTHYYAALTECIIYGFLIICLLIKDRKNWKKCLILIFTTIIGYMAWMPIFIKQFTRVSGNWWLETFDSKTILSCITYIFDGKFTYIYLVLFSTIFIEAIINIRKKNKELYFAIIAMLSFILTVSIGCIVSKLIRPMFVSRYMYVAVGLLFLGASIGITKSNYKNLLRNFLIALIIINIPFTYEQIYNKEYKTGTEEFKKIARETIKDEPISSDIEKLNWTILAYYCPNNKLLKNINAKTKGYVITNKDKKELEKIISNSKVKFIYKGNIDNQYYFNIYYVQ